MNEQEAFEAWFDANKRASSNYDEQQKIWHAALAWLRSQGEPVASAPDGVVEALQRLIENGATLGPASADDALLVARYRQAMLAPQPAIPNRVVNAITVILADAMAQAVENGADSRSMPDEYVEVAAWLAKLPDDTDPQPAIPDGWKLVPVEPTPSMIWAAAELSGYPGTSEKYRAMLNAAPEPRK